MKKKQIKALKQLADTLPESYELIKNTRFSTERTLKKINHLQKLKRSFVKKGNTGLVEYVEWLNRNNIRINKIYEKLKAENEDSNKVYAD